MNRFFSINERAKTILAVGQKDYDLIIIGGGVTGAGIALDAASRGLKTLLIEKKDFASGTSSKSTKLIHGGLRYLKQFEFGLVKESGHERAIVHHLAPHLVQPEKMLLPIVKGGSFKKWTASLAISVYDFLAGVKSEDRKKSLDKTTAFAKEPLLDRSILSGAMLYSEYRTDDARLTFELILKAFHLGVDIISYCEFIDGIYENGRICGIKFTDYISEKNFSAKGQCVVSSTGPWVDELRAKDNSLNAKHVVLSKGIHLVFDRTDLPVKQAVYFDDFKGRMLFAIPRQNVTYVGTTDTLYQEDKDNVEVTKDDINYVLDATNRYFDIEPLTTAKIISSWAGLRPLVAEKGKSTTEISRKDEIFISDSDLISIAGGKLTGYRKMAERIVDLVEEKLPHVSKSECQTKDIKLGEHPFDDFETFVKFKNNLKKEWQGYELPQGRIDYLSATYGKLADQILKASLIYFKHGSDIEEAIMLAEIHHGLENECCWKPSDFYNRRTGMLYFEPSRLIRFYPVILSHFAQYYQWDDRQYQSIDNESREEIEKATFCKL